VIFTRFSLASSFCCSYKNYLTTRQSRVVLWIWCWHSEYGVDDWINCCMVDGFDDVQTIYTCFIL